ncbi:hypothetical protein [Persicobacter diffluens]
MSNRLHLFFLSVLLLSVTIACNREDEFRAEHPKNLQYASITDYSIGDLFISPQPSIEGGGNMTFSIVGFSGPEGLDDERMASYISIVPETGEIILAEYCQLVEGAYSLDIKAENSKGNETFPKAFNLIANMSEANGINYTPSIVSIRGKDVDFKTNPAQVKGGGNFTFAFSEPQEYLQIDPQTGQISLISEVAIGDDDFISQKIGVIAENELGESYNANAIEIEVIGNNVGAILYNLEMGSHQRTDPGFLNGGSQIFMDEYSFEYDGTPGTVELNNGSYSYTPANGFRFQWYSQELAVTNELEEEVFEKLALFHPSNGNNNTVSYLFTDAIAIPDELKGAYIDLMGYSMAGKVLHEFGRLSLWAMEEVESFDEEEPEFSDLIMVSDFLQEKVCQYGRNDSKIRISDLMRNWDEFVDDNNNNIPAGQTLNGGRSQHVLPAELVGKKVRLVMKMENFNPQIDGVSAVRGRRYGFWKFQVREQQ